MLVQTHVIEKEVQDLSQYTVKNSFNIFSITVIYLKPRRNSVSLKQAFFVR